MSAGKDYKQERTKASFKIPYSVYSTFDLIQHKQTYTNYLEVIIDKYGGVHYAVPSHQEWLIKCACRELHCTRDELMWLICPENKRCDFMQWLCEVTNCIAVWTEGYMANTINEAQQEVLNTFMKEKLMDNRRFS